MRLALMLMILFPEWTSAQVGIQPIIDPPRLMTCYGLPQTCVDPLTGVEVPPPAPQPVPPPVRLDAKPLIYLGVGLVADRASTHGAIGKYDFCGEGNPRYTQPPYSPQRPNFGRMWTDAGAVFVSYAAIEGAAWWLSNRTVVRRTPWLRNTMKGFRWSSHSLGYAGGAAFMAVATNNIAQCM